MTKTSPSARTAPSAAGRGRRRVPASAEAAAGSRDARRRVAAVLDVWTGLCTPLEAAQLLGVSLPRYYVFETRLLEQMIEACEDRPRGRQLGPEREIAVLKREVERLKQECARKQALVRVVQRTAGLPLPERRPVTAKGKKRPRRPTIRALAIASALRNDPTPEPAPGNAAP